MVSVGSVDVEAAKDCSHILNSTSHCIPCPTHHSVTLTSGLRVHRSF